MATNKFIVKDKSHGKYAKKLFGVKCILTNFQPTLHFPYPLKTSENPRFSDIFTRYRRETVENGLSQVLVKLLRLMLSYLRCVFSSFTKSLHSFVIISILRRYVCNELKSSRLACESWFLKRISISWIFKKKSLQRKLCSTGMVIKVKQPYNLEILLYIQHCYDLLWKIYVDQRILLIFFN